MIQETAILLYKFLMQTAFNYHALFWSFHLKKDTVK